MKRLFSTILLTGLLLNIAPVHAGLLTPRAGWLTRLTQPAAHVQTNSHWAAQHPVITLAGLSVLGLTTYGLWNYWSKQQPQLSSSTPSTARNDIQHPTLPAWYQRCASRQNLQNGNALIPFETFNDQRLTFTKLMHTHHQTTTWLDTHWFSGLFNKIYNLLNVEPKKSVTFVEKLSIPQNSTVYFHGDLHGDIAALVTFLKSLSDQKIMDNAFRITQKDTYIVFLGDYTDRGPHGVEVLYTLWRLKEANPDRVFMVRGNHEDINLNKDFGLKDEFDKKYPNETEQERNARLYEVSTTYDFLPAALFLGSGNDYILCCHGGHELGFDPKPLLGLKNSHAYAPLDKLTRTAHRSTARLFEDTTSAHQFFGTTRLGNLQNCGFMWNDFQVNPDARSQWDPGRGYILSKDFTNYTLGTAYSNDTIKVRGIFRAHQHTNTVDTSSNSGRMMRLILNKDNILSPADTGVGKLWVTGPQPQPAALWDGIVCTFNVAPNAGYAWNAYTPDPLFDYDTYGILHMKTGGFKKWKLDVKRNQHLDVKRNDRLLWRSNPWELL